MTSGAQNQNEEAQKRKASLAILRGFAFVLANCRTYGFRHKVTQDAICSVAKALGTYQRAFGALTFSAGNGGIVLFGKPVERSSANLSDLARSLSDLGAGSLSFGVGLTAPELAKWFQLVVSGAKPGQKGFGALLASSGLPHVSADSYSLQKVSDDEIVARRDEVGPIGRLRNATPLRTARRLLDAISPGQALPPLGIRVEDEEIFDDLVRLAMPPAESDAKGAAALAEEAIDRVERLGAGLLANPANRTQAGRRALKKLLKAVEEKMIERLQKLGADIDAVERLASRVKELVENVAIDGVVAKYVRLRDEFAGAESRLTRRIRHSMKTGGDAGAEDIGKRLMDAGLPEDAVRNLMDTAGRGKKGAAAAAHGGDGEDGGDAPAGKKDDGEEEGGGAGEGGGPGGPGEDSPLMSLLARLKETPPGSGDLPSLVDEILAEMNKVLLKTQERANRQLDSLKRKMSPPPGRPEGALMSRDELFRILSELGQELKQPLTVVAGATQMFSGDSFGALSDDQRKMISMVSESAAELDALIGRFISVVGFPATLRPGALDRPCRLK